MRITNAKFVLVLIYDNVIGILHKISGIVKKKTTELTVTS